MRAQCSRVFRSFVRHKNRTHAEAKRQKGGTEAASLALQLTLPPALNRLCVHQISRWTVCVMALGLVVAAALTKRCVVSGLFRSGLALLKAFQAAKRGVLCHV